MIGFEICDDKFKYIIKDHEEIDVTENETGEKRLEIHREGKNTKRLEILKSFPKKYSYDPSVIILGVVAPACNLRCPYCSRNTAIQHCDTEATTPEALAYILDKLRQNNIKAEITFFNNEVFKEDHKEWQQSLVDVIRDNSDIVVAIMAFSNGKEIGDPMTHPLFAYISNELEWDRGEVVIACSLNKEVPGGHMDITSEDLIKTIERTTKLVKLSLNVLLDTDSPSLNVDTIANFFNFTSSHQIYIDFCGIYQTDSKMEYSEENMKNVMDAAYKSPLLTKARNIGAYSMFSGELPIDIDNPPSYCILDKYNMVGIVSGQPVKVDENLIENIKGYLYDTTPDYNKCICGDKCVGLIEENKCPIDIRAKCLKCPIFGTCSGWHHYKEFTDRDCEMEVFSVQALFAMSCATSRRVSEILDIKDISVIFNGLNKNKKLTKGYWSRVNEV